MYKRKGGQKQARLGFVMPAHFKGVGGFRGGRQVQARAPAVALAFGLHTHTKPPPAPDLSTKWKKILTTDYTDQHGYYALHIRAHPRHPRFNAVPKQACLPARNGVLSEA